MDLIPKPDQLVAAASNVAHKVLYGGLADLRPMPRTLIDEGELREVYHYRPVAGVARAGRPGAAGDAARRAGALLRPAPRLLARRALRRRRPADVPPRVRRGVVPQPRARHRALGRRGRCPTAIDEVSRTPGAVRCTWSAGAWAGSSACSPPPTARDLPIASVTVVGSPVDVARCRWSRPCGRCSTSPRVGLRSPRLPGDGRCPEAAGEVGLPALVVPEADHQAARAGHPSGRRRLPRPDRGGRPVHRQHDRLPRPQLRTALPPLRARATCSAPGEFELVDRTIGLAASRSRCSSSPAPPTASPRCRGQGGRAPAHRRPRGAVRDRPRRPPRDAHRPGRARHDLAGLDEWIGQWSTRSRRPSRARPRRRRPRRRRRRRPSPRRPSPKKAPRRGSPRPTADAIGVNPTRRYGSAGSRSLAR